MRVGYEFCRSNGAFQVLDWLAAGRAYRYVFALTAVAAAVVSQRGLEKAIGFSHSFLLFYPTIFVVALLAGFWPGVTATALSEVAVIYFYTRPSSLPTGRR